MHYVTLSDKRLVHVEQDVAAFHDHPLDGEVLPDVLGLAHLILHDLQKDKVKVKVTVYQGRDRGQGKTDGIQGEVKFKIWVKLMTSQYQN